MQTDNLRSSVIDLSITGLDIKYIRAGYIIIISFFSGEIDLCFFFLVVIVFGVINLLLIQMHCRENGFLGELPY